MLRLSCKQLVKMQVQQIMQTEGVILYSRLFRAQRRALSHVLRLPSLGEPLQTIQTIEDRSRTQ
jgi:hypothetical protein